MRSWFACCWSVWRDHCAAGQDTDLDRGGCNRLAARVYGAECAGADKLEQSPFSGHVFVFRGRRGDLIKVLWDMTGMVCAYSRSGWSAGASCGRKLKVARFFLTRAQLSMLLEGIDWRRPERTWEPQLSV